jgi:hypothetical protein
MIQLKPEAMPHTHQQVTIRTTTSQRSSLYRSNTHYLTSEHALFQYKPQVLHAAPQINLTNPIHANFESAGIEFYGEEK